MLVQVLESILEIKRDAQVTGESRRGLPASIPLQESSDIQEQATRVVQEALIAVTILLAS